MITGFNTDVDYQDRVLHVQTEDKGAGNPVLESLIYCGGEIIATRKSSYSDLTEAGAYEEDEVLRRMEMQHQAMIREIFNGGFDSEEPKPFGHNIVTNRTLDEVVLMFLTESVKTTTIELEMVDEQVLFEGTRPTLRLRAADPSSGIPYAHAHVTIKLLSTSGKNLELFSSATDEEGFLEASFAIPELPGGGAALLCEVDAAGQKAETRQLIRKVPVVDSAETA